MRIARLLAVMAAAGVLAACSAGGATTARTVAQASAAQTGVGSASSAPATPTTLEVYAAASLKPVLERVRTAWTAANPGSSLVVSIDSSAALETKIEQGAPADVFLSADMTSPRRLVDGGFASGAVVPIAGNLLTVIVPKGNPAAIRSPADLARAGVKVIAAADEVPITAYAGRLVDNLAAQPGYPAGFADAYRANVVSREDNVAAVVAKVALGEGDAGIVYATDAASNPDVEQVEVPAAANVPATYGGVVVRTTDAPDAAAAFLDWLAAGDGQALLRSFGFQPPAP